MAKQETWREDWEAFVRSVGELFDRGFDGNAVTEHFAGEQVTWTGVVAEKRLTSTIASPGVRMNMLPVVAELRDGRHAIVDYLFLSLKEDDLAAWGRLPLGARVRFQTRIQRSSGPFPGIQWLALGDQRGLILLQTDGAKPVQSA